MLIQVKVNRDSMMDGWPQEDIDGLDVDASEQKFLDNVLKEIKKIYSEDEVTVEMCDGLVNNEIRIQAEDGTWNNPGWQYNDTVAQIEQVIADEYGCMEWLVYKVGG